MEKVNETCALCKKEYVPHHIPEFRSGFCGPCEEDMLYWEEIREMQEIMEMQESMEEGDAG